MSDLGVKAIAAAIAVAAAIGAVLAAVRLAAAAPAVRGKCPRCVRKCRLEVKQMIQKL